MNHAFTCTCQDCRAANDAAASLMLQRSPKAILAHARRGTDDKFAFGLLLRIEQELAGVPPLQPEMLAQQATPKIDPESVSDNGVDYRKWRHA